MAAGGLATVDAAGHAYPAAQSPLHADTAKPCELPNLPAGQSTQLLAAVVDEYRPTAHSVHDPAKQSNEAAQCSGDTQRQVMRSRNDTSTRIAIATHTTPHHTHPPADQTPTKSTQQTVRSPYLLVL